MRNFTEQTHFIGAVLPDVLVEKITAFRRYTHDRYGCRSGHSTPPHITLVPPFVIEDGYSTDDLARAIMALDARPFNCTVDGFGSFDERTVFAHVKTSREWTDLKDRVSGAVKDLGSIRMDRRPFRPHITIANRDIPPGKTMQILEYLSAFDISTTFSVDTIAVFERRDHRWAEAERLFLRG